MYSVLCGCFRSFSHTFNMVTWVHILMVLFTAFIIIKSKGFYLSASDVKFSASSDV